MRQRITFLHNPEDAIDPKKVRVTGSTLTVSGLRAVREDRITLGLEELPKDIRNVLQRSHELHIRYVRSAYHENISPLLSRLSPGLHVYYSPQRSAGNADALCPLLNRIFQPTDPSMCQSPQISFTRLPSQRFQHSTEFEYYLPQSALHPHSVFDHLLNLLCPVHDPVCFQRVGTLQTASSLELDYDTISHSLNLIAIYPSQTWKSTISSNSESSLEVGILSPETATEPEELSLGGFLTVVGEDSTPGPTLFSFPARHHQHDSTYSSTFLLPTGLHPTMRIEVSDATPPKHENQKSCTLHAHLTLPKSIFADKYQFEDSMFLASKNLSAIQYITSPVDLEAPSYTTSLWGSSLLLSLAPPTPPSSSTPATTLLPFSANIPLHLRYLPLSTDGSSYRSLQIPNPVVFWACPADEGSKFSVNPFDRVNLGYDGLFGPRTIFHHLQPAPKKTPLEVVRTGNSLGVRKVGAAGDADLAALQDGYMSITVPVLDTRYAKLVELGTALAVLLGFGWVLYKLWLVWRREGYGSGKVAEKEKEKAKEKKTK